MENAIKYAWTLLGLPYRWGGDDPMFGFDCSGIVQEVLASVGLDPVGDQSAHALYLHFKNPLYGKQGLAESGSLCFFGTPTNVIHVGFCLDKYQMFESGGGGSKTNTLQDAIDQNAYSRIRPIHSRKDFVIAIRPIYPF